MSILGLSSDTTISQTKFYLDEVRKVAGEASSTPTASVSTTAVTDTKGTAPSGAAAAGSPADSYNVYIKSDLSNVVGYAPGSTSAAQPVFSTTPADPSTISTAAAQSAGSGTAPVSSTAGPASSVPTFFGSSVPVPGTTATAPGSSQTPDAQGTDSTKSTAATPNDTTSQDNDSDDVQAYSVLVNDLTMLASLIQSGDMPNARTTAGTVIKDLNNYLSQPSQNPPVPNGQTPKSVVQSFSSLLASVQEGDNASASTIVNAIKVIS